MLRPRLTVCAVALSCVAGCVYPRHATPVLTVMQPQIDRTSQPDNLWQLQLVELDIPRQKRTGLSWDDDGGLPDPYLVIRIKGEERWRTSVAEDTFEPQFGVSPNLAFDRSQRLRIEVWDRDGMASDPIGMYEGRFLSETILDAETTVKLDSGASVTLRLRKPEPKQGVGIEYELRPSAAVILVVSPHSPAWRARLTPGDHVVAIDGKAVAKLAPEQIESALALAAQNQSELSVEREIKTKTKTAKSKLKLKLDGGYIWPGQ